MRLHESLEHDAPICLLLLARPFCMWQNLNTSIIILLRFYMPKPWYCQARCFGKLQIEFDHMGFFDVHLNLSAHVFCAFRPHPNAVAIVSRVLHTSHLTHDTTVIMTAIDPVPSSLVMHHPTCQPTTAGKHMKCPSFLAAPVWWPCCTFFGIGPLCYCLQDQRIG